MARSTAADPEVDDFAGPDIAEPDFSPPSHIARKGEPGYNPNVYFGAQPKEWIIVHRNASDILDDPNGTKDLKQIFSINEYDIWVTKGKPTQVPKDFADFIVWIKAGDRISG